MYYSVKDWKVMRQESLFSLNDIEITYIRTDIQKAESA